MQANARELRELRREQRELDLAYLQEVVASRDAFRAVHELDVRVLHEVRVRQEQDALRRVLVLVLVQRLEVRPERPPLVQLRERQERELR